MTLVILAAGMGSRYGGLKQLDPVTPNGEFIIDFSIYDAIRAGYDRVVFIIKKENYELFRETVGHRIEKHIRTSYVFQPAVPETDVVLPADRVKPWGTGHALLSCLGTVKEPFAVINADDFYGSSSYALVKDYLENAAKDGNKAHFCISSYILKNTLSESGTVSRGICAVDGAGMLADITEHTKIGYGDKAAVSQTPDGEVALPYDTPVSMNFFGFTPEMLDYAKEGFDAFLHREGTDLYKGEYYLPTAVKEAMDAGKCDVRVLYTEDRWYGVTYAADKPLLVENIRRMIAEGQYPENLWGEVTER